MGEWGRGESKLTFESEAFWKICIMYFLLKVIFYIYKCSHEFSSSEEKQWAEIADPKLKAKEDCVLSMTCLESPPP